MAARETKHRTPKKQVQYPQETKRERSRRGWRAGGSVLVFAVVVAVGAFLLGREDAQGPSEAVAPPASGLPATPDYHSLLVHPSDPERIVLGTHAGLYESSNGGRTWKQAGLTGRDAMNLARTSQGTIWTAGHNVLAKSENGGESWSDVNPAGLPSLDVHGFAVDPSNSGSLYAAVAGEGLYQSSDGGGAFELISEEVGPSVFGLAATPDGRVIAADPGRGLMESPDGGDSWRLAERGGFLGVAVSPADADTVLATGPGILLSEDGGRTWGQVFTTNEVVGPVAWSPSQPATAYAVAFPQPQLLNDPGSEPAPGTLYRTDDGGVSWHAVE
jgi:photosystem II stability/assembly factor-like uncharacterized protein